MSDPVETMTFDSGITARIFHDEGVDIPFSFDDAVRIVVLHRRYIDPCEGACGRDPDEVAAWERENAEEWFTIPLFLHDHSGTVYRVGASNPFSCPWDSGRVGIIALRRAEWGDDEAKLTEYAEEIAADYTAWANGECYRFELSDAAGHELDAWWGFIGIQRARDQAAKSAARFAAQASESVARAWGIACPRCGQSDAIDIAATVWVRLYPDGTDPAGAACGDHEWSDEHAVCCRACGFAGRVADFRANGTKGDAS